ncbi:MAG: SDR family NAD(P)-dependent oxidoreductase [Gammaproteobacteria bacterium]
MEIKEQVAIVTGGASGMGAETAKQLIQAGAKVALLDNNAVAVKQAAQTMGALPVPCDVADPKNAEAAFEKINATLGKARICINCAGIVAAKRIVGQQGAMPLADFQQVIQVNLIGTFNILRLAAATMSQLPLLDQETGERGIIINTASIAAFEGQIGQAAYSASKGGVVALTLPAARELAKFGIRVMAIAPGLVSTPMLESLPDKVRNDLIAAIPFPRRFGLPSEYAKLVLHIINNPLLNGEVIRLDGALRMPA